MVMNGDYYSATPVYIVDLKTKSKRWISNDVLCNSANIAKDGRIYYVKLIKLEIINMQFILAEKMDLERKK